MPKRPKEMEREILNDGWVLKSQEGSHRHYVHPIKPGKVTINGIGNDDIYGELLKSIEEQSGLEF